MHQSPKHPRARALRMISYVFIVGFVVTGTYILTRYTQGFEIDPETRSLVQNGLVLVESEPVESAVFIDNKDSGEVTPSRVTLPVGQHTVRLQADGYRTWSKSFQIVGSDLVWMNYPMLIPENITTESRAVFEKAPITALSRNRRTLASGQPNSKVISIFNINGDQTSESEITLPKPVLETLEKTALTKLTFAADDQFLLAEFSSGTEKSFVLINRDNVTTAIIMDDTYNIDFDEMQFDSGDADQLYALSNNTLYQIQRTDIERSRKIAENVISFRSDADQLSIIKVDASNPKTPQRFGIIRDDKVTLLGGELAKGPYRIAHGDYEGNETFAISDAKKVVVFSRDDTAQALAKKTIAVSDATLNFSGDGRFLLLRSGSTSVVLDFEFNKRYSFELSGKVTSDVRWIDDAHISMVIDGTATIVEFDGENSQPIVDADPVMAPLTNNNSESYFSFSKSKNRYILEQSSLLYEK
jgi:hypothetical protein